MAYIIAHHFILISFHRWERGWERLGSSPYLTYLGVTVHCKVFLIHKVSPVFPSTSCPIHRTLTQHSACEHLDFTKDSRVEEANLSKQTGVNYQRGRINHKFTTGLAPGMWRDDSQERVHRKVPLHFVSFISSAGWYLYGCFYVGLYKCSFVLHVS